MNVCDVCAQSYRRSKCLSPRLRAPSPYCLLRYRGAYHVADIRLASTVTPKSSTAQTDLHVPPPNPPRGHKKMELKPGPVKPATLRVDAVPSRPPSPDASSHAYYRPPRHTTPPTPAESSLSAIALAKQDIVSAAERGVLAPVPNDATPFKRFTHQALQLLVRALAPLQGPA